MTHHAPKGMTQNFDLAVSMRRSRHAFPRGKGMRPQARFGAVKIASPEGKLSSVSETDEECGRKSGLI